MVKHALFKKYIYMVTYFLVLYESLTDTGFQDVMSDQAIQHHTPLDHSFHVFIAMRTQNCNNHIHDKNITFNRTHAGDTITPSSIFSPDSCKINILMYEVSQYCNYSNSFLINTFFSHPCE